MECLVLLAIILLIFPFKITIKKEKDEVIITNGKKEGNK